MERDISRGIFEYLHDAKGFRKKFIQLVLGSRGWKGWRYVLVLEDTNSSPNSSTCAAQDDMSDYTLSFKCESEEFEQGSLPKR